VWKVCKYRRPVNRLERRELGRRTAAEKELVLVHTQGVSVVFELDGLSPSMIQGLESARAGFEESNFSNRALARLSDESAFAASTKAQAQPIKFP